MPSLLQCLFCVSADCGMGDEQVHASRGSAVYIYGISRARAGHVHCAAAGEQPSHRRALDGQGEVRRRARGGPRQRVLLGAGVGGPQPGFQEGSSEGGAVRQQEARLKHRGTRHAAKHRAAGLQNEARVACQPKGSEPAAPRGATRKGGGPVARQRNAVGCVAVPAAALPAAQDRGEAAEEERVRASGVPAALPLPSQMHGPALLAHQSGLQAPAASQASSSALVGVWSCGGTQPRRSRHCTPALTTCKRWAGVEGEGRAA